MMLVQVDTQQGKVGKERDKWESQREYNYQTCAESDSKRSIELRAEIKRDRYCKGSVNLGEIGVTC